MEVVSRLLVLTLAFVLAFPVLASADGFTSWNADWWRNFNLDPLIVLNLCVLGWIYHRGLMRLWRRPAWRIRLGAMHAFAFWGSLAALFVALLSPLDALSDVCFAGHMTQHMILAVVAAPLFAFGAPAAVIACGTSPELRRWLSIGPFWRRGGWNPVATWLLYAVILWGWHHPFFYRAALRDPLVHDAQHLSIFLAGVLFWRVAIDPLSHKRLSPPVSVLYLFTTTLHASALSVFITFAPQPWYDEYAMSISVVNLSPLADQQLAGLIMWFPSCLAYPAVAVGLVGSWLAHDSEVTAPFCFNQTR